MTSTRVAAAAAAILTALLLQATLVAPVALPVPVSLPAVLVAAVALHAGPGTGISLGFCAGLLADLGSSHPAGVLALSWLGLGVGCGVLADARRPLLRRVVLVAVTAALASLGAAVLLAAAGSSGQSAASVLSDLPATVLGDALLALAVVPLSRGFLRADAMRAPQVPRERGVLGRG